MPPRKRAVLFDVDGTLLDTNYLHVLAWSRAFIEHGLQPPMAAIHALVGMGSDKLLERLAGGERPDIDAGHSRHYKALQGDMRAFEGAAGVLRATHDAGSLVVLATSAKGDEVEPILHTIGAGDAVDVVVSSADVEHSKPDPDIFTEALRRAGVGAADAIVVGDTVWDIEAARRCGLECICVTTGGIAREVLEQAGARAVYARIEDVKLD